MVFALVACVLFGAYQYREEQELRERFRVSEVLTNAAGATIVVSPVGSCEGLDWNDIKIDYINKKALKVIESINEGKGSLKERLLSIVKLPLDVRCPRTEVKALGSKVFKIKYQSLGHDQL